MDPEQALARIVHCLDRAHVGGFKAKAWSGALARVRQTDPAELARLAASGDLKQLPGIGDASAKAITEALGGEVPSYLVKLEAETVLPITPQGAVIQAALRGDCHSHSTWSDGGASIEAMATTARDLGHEYLVLTDHSPRLTVAHGLSRERLLSQLGEVATLNEALAPFRILRGMEVDILEDGSLDLDDDLLERLDVVVASVHSKLRSDRQTMTERMVLAVASPHVDILGHCTGRLIDKRPPSVFDADYVFAACAQFGTAVEINCRPERLDPPLDLLDAAIDHGCFFSIDTDAHATGQLEWQPHGCDRAADRGVPIERIINSWSMDDLLAWAASK